MSVNRNAVAGVLLIVLAGLIAFKLHGTWSAGSIFEYFWPTLFVIPLGIFFHWLYFFLDQRGVGLLVPGGILLTAGLVCQIATVFDSWDIMWPGFIFAPAAGLLELYLFGNRNRWLLIPINILTALSVLFFAVFAAGAIMGRLSGLKPLLVLGMAVIGFIMLFMRKLDNAFSSRREPWE